MFNIFNSTKKKEQLYTPANQNMSVYTPAKSTSNPTSLWASNLSNNGVNATQSLFSSQIPQAPKVTTKTQQTNQSVMNSSAPRVVQGSGMTSNYASNPINYKPAPVPKVTTQQANPRVQNIEDFLKGQEGIAGQKKQLAESLYNKGNEYRTGTYNLQQEQLKGMRSDANTAFSNFEKGTLAGLDRLVAAGERNKGNVEDYYGDAQRTAAQARTETQGDAQRRFANLNTIDSFGEGSFQQANENIDSDFNRLTQQFAREKANSLADIDDQVFSAQQTAEQAINTERSNLQQTLRQIDAQLQQGTMDYVMAQDQAYGEYQDTVLGIQDWFNNINLSAQQQKLSIQDELAKMQSFTPKFMATGVPTNQQEYEFLINNQEAFTNLYGFGADPNKAKAAATLSLEGKASAGLRALDEIRSQLSSNPGTLLQSVIPGSPGARQYEAAVSSITDAIGGLRTGASVSPEQQAFYRNLLPKVGDSQATIDKKIKSIEQELSGYLTGATYSPNTSRSVDNNQLVRQFGG